jgi:hypothetical protein
LNFGVAVVFVVVTCIGKKIPVVGLEKRFEDPQIKTYAVFDTPNNFAFKGGVAFNTQVFCNQENTCPYKRCKRSLLQELELPCCCCCCSSSSSSS